MDSFEKHCEFEKVDDAGVIYGWALVCTENGKPYVDLQGDHVPEDVMVDAAVDFASNSRVGKDMHDGSKVADVLFTYPITASSNTLGLSTNKTGLVIGYKPHDKELLAAVKRGERTGFSIGGTLADHDAVGKAIAKAAGGVPNQHRRTFRSFKIAEISLVDVPAMEGATVGYVKRAIATREPSILKISPTFERAVTKAMVATSIVDGHAHIVDLDDPATERWSSLQTSYQNADGAECGHSHGWTFDASGAIAIAPDSGHTHSVADVVPPQTVTAAAALEAAEQARITAIPAALVDDPSDGIPITFADEESSGKTINVVIAARAPAAISTRPPPLTSVKSIPKETAMPEPITITKNVAVVLSEAQGAFLKNLAASEHDAFLAKSFSERDALVKAAVEADPIVYTTKSGVPVRKSAGDLAVMFAKQADDANALIAATQAEVTKANLATEAVALEKRATSELSHFGKSVSLRAKVLKAIDVYAGFTAEERVEVSEMLKGVNHATSEITVARGINPQTGAQGGLAKSELRTHVEKYQADHKIPTYEQALLKATAPGPTGDEKARDLMARAHDERMAGNA